MDRRQRLSAAFARAQRHVATTLGLAAALAGGAGAWPTSPGALAPCTRAQEREDAPERAARWLAKARSDGDRMGPEHLALLRFIVADLRVLLASRAELRETVAVALLDIAALAPRTARESWNTPTEEASTQAFEALERGLELDRDGAFARLLARQVQPSPARTSVERRRAALEALRGWRIEATLPALLGATDDPARELRDVASAALSGWDHPQVHSAFIAQFLRIRSDPSWSAARHGERHFAAVRLPAGGPLERALFDALRVDLVGRDWRRTLRALRASEALDNALAMPTLIESLSLWVGRRRSHEAQGASALRTPREGVSRRVEQEFVLALQRRSGKRIGAHPERWSSWWRSARDAAERGDGEQHAHVSTAGFYGLRPVTDRVCFVIDRSTSMERSDGGQRTRYHRALSELERFLTDLGPGARFRVVLFSSDLKVWKDELVPVDAGAISSVLHWAGELGANGGTELRPAIEHVLRLDRKGEPALERLEEDTVIVLCDGATAEGPRWVEPLLERVGAATCVAFHCVQIGRHGGDGVLRALAELSGGDYVETDD